MVANSEYSYLENLLDHAQAYLDAGEIDRSIAVLQEAYKIDPRNLRVCSLLGFCALHKGKLDDANKYFSFVLSVDPDNSSARIGLKHATDHMAEPPTPAASQSVVDKQVEPAEDVSHIPVSLATRLHIYFGCAANGVVLGTIFVFVAIFVAGQSLFGQISNPRAAGFWLMAGAVIGGFIGLLFAPRTIQKYREHAAGKRKSTKENTRSVGQAAKRQGKSMKILWLGILLIAVGMFLPWINVSSGTFGLQSATGWRLNEGIITAAAGILQAVFGIFSGENWRRPAGGIILIASAVVIVITVSSILSVPEMRENMDTFFGSELGRFHQQAFGQTMRVSFANGIGVFVTLLGGFITALAGIIFLRPPISSNR